MSKVNKIDIEKLTPKQLHKLRMESPDNNMTNCWRELRILKMDFSYANYLLSLSPNEKPTSKKEFNP